MRELQHPAVVRVYDPGGEDDSFCYFVMELVPSGNLREAVLGNRVEAGRRLALILQVGEALAEAHGKLLIHRDIKPANILLDGEGNAKLTDFDLVGAHDTTGGTRTGALGTVVYAAPECLDRPQDATARADVFGLGMTAIFCLAGHDLSMDTLVDRAGALAQLVCTASIRKVLECAVEWKPDRRFADAADMVDALRDALAVSSQRAAADDRRAVGTQPAVPASSVTPAVDQSRANDDEANSGSTLHPAHKRFRAAVVRMPVIGAVAAMLSLVSGVAFVALRGGESTGDGAATSSPHGSATAAPSTQVVQPPVDSPPPTATAAPSTQVVQPPVDNPLPTASPAVTGSAHGTAAHGGRADQLLKKGQKLLAEKRYVEACTAFEDSDRIAPEIGVKLGVARCYQEWGKLATAWRWYTDAEQMASAVRDTRTPKIHALIEDIDRDVPHLTLVLPPGAVTDHLAIRLDGVALALALATVDDERRIDPGPHEIAIIIDDKPRTKTIPVLRGDRIRVALDVPTRPARGGGR
jgi:serine/threonine protein kinase